MRALFCIVLFEFCLFIFSGVSFSFLHNDSFFSIGADPFFLLLYATKLPQFILSHYWFAFALDALIILLFIFFIRDPFNDKIAIGLLLLLLLFYITLTGYLTHRNYQVGFFMVFIPFIFKKEISKQFAFEAIRYFILFFYFSAAVLKLSNSSLFQADHFSKMLTAQFAPYFLEGNTGFRTSLNLYLIQHSHIAYILYLGSFFIELSMIMGFFTKRFDKWLATALLLFHFTTWLVMDIAPFGQAGFICLLFLSRAFTTNNIHK